MKKYKKNSLGISILFLVLGFSIMVSDNSLDVFTKIILGECKADSEMLAKEGAQGVDLPEINRKELEERVNQLLKKDNVSLRRNVDEVFLLADIYVNEGKEKEAINLYQEALKVNSWRLEYRLKLARLLRKYDYINEAAEKAEIVWQYAEDEALIIEAERFLSEFKMKFAEQIKKKPQKFIEFVRCYLIQPHKLNVEIVMVPIGKVNKRLLSEVRKELQESVGIKYSIAEKGFDLGKIDRSFANRYLTDVVDHIKSEFSQEAVKELLFEKNLTEVDLETYDGKIKFVEAYFAKIKLPLEKILEFNERLKRLENQGQFDASRLRSDLQGYYVIKKKSLIKGYLGITGEDIFSEDDNFLFGLAGMGYGVMSYHRFTAAFNDEPPNRPRLRKRMVKQVISSSFFILGIPRCTTPSCARAYPHSLTEHDQKNIEICSWCKRQLSTYIKKNR